VSWKATGSCNTTYVELFGARDSRDFQLYASQGIDRIVVHPAIMDEVLHLKWKGNVQGVGGVKVRQRVVLLQTTAFFQLSHVSCQEYLQRKQYFYQSLMLHKPIPVVSDILFQTFEQRLRKRLVVGVHIRVDDPSHDWPIVPPQPGQATGFRSWGEVAPEAMFLGVMTQIKKRHPRVLFFVASNSITTRRRVAAAFDTQDVLTVEVDESLQGADQRSTAFGMKRALLDWLMLAHTSLIVHGYRSSFGEEAAQMYLVPSIQLRAGGHVLGPDLNSRHCNQHVISADDHERECLHPVSGDENPPHENPTGSEGDFDQQAWMQSVCPRKVIIREDKRMEAAWGVSGVHGEVDWAG
jgi:hypothetical protein